MTSDDLTANRERISNDPLCRTLGIEFERIEPNYAETTLDVTADLTNFNGKLHGAVIFALADAAAGAADQANGTTTVGIETSTSFLTAVEPGETLTATAEVVHESAKFSTTQASVETTDGTEVATFNARGYRID
ncbi:PaaI family thioesterase [Natrinema gelatinilyticum]|uniref:PaaI family thioesterase n=1 Tax=Natrinema gelatinilyticum TaxID=2961571 RepID=UPI0020C310C0|nr:PaaI family thioesterase [Natrinema gelatinilyticum]